MKRRFLQFSLRGFLLALSLAGIALGWKVDSAHRRGQAIKTLIATGSSISYCDSALYGRPDLWSDLLGARVDISVWRPFTPEIGRNVVAASPVADLALLGPVDDTGLEHLYGLNSGCRLTIFEDEILVSRSEVNRFKRRHHRVEVKLVAFDGAEKTPISK